MQINFHRFKKPISFLCGLCLSLSIFYSRGLITYALPVEQSMSIELSNSGFKNLGNNDYTVDNGNNNRYSDYIEINPNYTYNSISCTLSGVSSVPVSQQEATSLFVVFYDENKNVLSDIRLNGAVTNTGNKFSSVINSSFSIPNNSKYFVLTTRAIKNNVPTLVYDVPISVTINYTYDDGSFNINALTLGQLNIMNTQTMQNFIENDSNSYYLDGYVSDEYDMNISFYGFKTQAYYDIDMVYEITMTPHPDNNLTVYKGLAPTAVMYYPQFIDLDLPSGLSYSWTYYSAQPTNVALSYSSENGNNSKYIPNVGQPYVLRLHIYGNTYVDDGFSGVIKFKDTIFFRDFYAGLNSTKMSSIFLWDISNTVSGVIQETSHGSTSEIEALENIDKSINDQTNEMIKEHEEELQKGQETSNELSSSLDNVTSTLTAIEILKLPWTMLKDLYNAIIKDGQTTLTFPSFELMGYTLWDAYEFDLETLDSNFTVLFQSLRLISGILICSAFGIYIRNYFVRLFGGDVEVD